LEAAGRVIGDAVNEQSLKAPAHGAILKILPYSGIPVLGALLPLIRPGRPDMLSMLCGEVLIVFGYVLTVSDIKTKRIPNGTVLAMLAVWTLIMTPQFFVDTAAALKLFIDSAIGSVIGGGLFLVVYLISRKGLGGGDVKFMAVAGLYLGYGSILPAMFCGTFIAMLTGIVLILAKKLNKKDAIPLVPFLYAGILIALYFR